MGLGPWGLPSKTGQTNQLDILMLPKLFPILPAPGGQLEESGGQLNPTKDLREDDVGLNPTLPPPPPEPDPILTNKTSSKKTKILPQKSQDIKSVSQPQVKPPPEDSKPQSQS